VLAVAVAHLMTALVELLELAALVLVDPLEQTLLQILVLVVVLRLSVTYRVTADQASSSSATLALLSKWLAVQLQSLAAM
jgi:hypothetical protein